MATQALKEGRLRAQALQPDERMRRPGLSTLVLDEADLMLSMPGYEEDLQAVAPLVPSSPALPCLQFEAPFLLASELLAYSTASRTG